MNDLQVSCTMLLNGKRKYFSEAIEYFLSQDYLSKELLIIDDTLESILNQLPNDQQIRYYHTEPIDTIGAKKNYLNYLTNGKLITHWDQYGWYATDWITKQVDFLINSDADVSGVEFTHSFSPATDIFLLGTANNRNNPACMGPTLDGSTLIYWKTFWENHHFQSLDQGEDADFLSNQGIKIYAHEYIDGYIKLLYPDYFANTQQRA